MHNCLLTFQNVERTIDSQLRAPDERPREEQGTAALQTSWSSPSKSDIARWSEDVIISFVDSIEFI